MKQWLIDNGITFSTSLKFILGAFATSIIGVICTKAARWGRLKVNPVKWNIDFKSYVPDGYGGQSDAKGIEQADALSYSLILEVINKSEKQRIIRNIEVQFYEGDKILYTDIPNGCNVENERSQKHACEKIYAFAIPAKEVIKINLDNTILINNANNIKVADSVKLSYKNELGISKRVMITYNPFNRNSIGV